ncbi:hypothetical protein KAH81_03355 [bacterium]|nr:hypothetical protein [bacterium]
MFINKILCILIIAYTLMGVSNSIPFPADFKAIDIASDGFGGFYLLDDFGQVIALDSTGQIRAELEDDALSMEIIHISDIALSVGWLYLADREGMAIFITDRNLRLPTRISLNLTGVKLRPDKIAVSTDGRILIYDAGKNEFYLFQDWRDTNPRQFLIPELKRVDKINSLGFDRVTKRFNITTSEAVYIYSLYGQPISTIHFTDVESPLGAFSGSDGFYIIGKKSAITIVDGIQKPMEFEAEVSAVIQNISGRMVLLYGNKIICVESLLKIE